MTPNIVVFQEKTKPQTSNRDTITGRANELIKSGEGKVQEHAK